MIVEGIRITNDYVFKKIFNDTEILRDFVSSIIDENLSWLKIINSEILPKTVGDKLSRLDILAETETRERINIEMQLSYSNGFDDRMAFYAMRLHAGNLKEGEKYQDVKRTIVIDILDFEHKLLKSRKGFCTDFRLRSLDGEVTLTNKFVIYFVEIAKIPDKTLDNLAKSEKWLLFLKNKGGSNMQLRQVLESEPMIARAISIAEALAKDKREMMIAQYREDAIRDEIAGRLTARDEGISLGRTEGISLGRTEGISLGRTEGISLGKLETARNMLKRGFDLRTVSEITGLSESELPN